MTGQIVVIREKIYHLPFLGPLLEHRFAKFGVVGAFGTIVNLVLLYLNQEVFFKAITPPEIRLKVSLAVAIFLATLHNFLLNRWWTWKDRKERVGHGFFVQMCQYYFACGLAMCLQYLITIVLAKVLFYLISNILAIGLSGILVYLVNDLWTFALPSQAWNRRGNSP